MLKIFCLISTTIMPLCLTGIAYAEEIGDCVVFGKWKNQLGSKMSLECKDGGLVGKYNSAVGRAEDYYPLSGRYTLSRDDKNVVLLGWVVSWNNEKYGNSQSVTSWSGIYYPEEGIIRTQWILTRYEELDSYWATSRVNHDEFYRVK